MSLWAFCVDVAVEHRDGSLWEELGLEKDAVWGNWGFRGLQLGLGLELELELELALGLD